MRSNRRKVVILSLLAVAIISAGWLFGIAPQISDASQANGRRLTVLSENATNEATLRKLKTDYVGMDGIRIQLSLLKVSVPSRQEISTLITELNSLANSNKVTVSSITVNEAKPYAQVAATTNSLITSNNFVVIPVQFSITGGYSNVLEFVHEVQVGSRLFLISNFSSTGATDAKAVAVRGTKSGPNSFQKVDATIGGYVYVLINGSK